MRLTTVLLAATLVLTGGVAAWGLQQQRAGDSAEYRVEVVGPDGPLFEETVAVEAATALAALEAAAARRGLALTLEEYPGMGTYVRAIGPHRAAGVSGWIYEVEREGAWVSGDRSAARYALEKGDALRWSWTSG